MRPAGIVALVGVLALALNVPMAHAAGAADNVVPDAAFQGCLNGYLSQAADAPITAAQLEGLYMPIDCENPAITSIEGAEYLAQVPNLDLLGTQVSDLSPVAGLTGLDILDLEFTQVSDLSPLSGMTSLTWLLLQGTPVSDLSPLSGLTGLSLLDLGGTPVSDLSPLSGITGMTTLRVGGTQVSDLSPLSGMTSLSSLALNETQVSDLSGLSGLTGLTDLQLVNTGVSDLSALSGLTGLTTLYLDNTDVSDLSVLSGLTALQTLSLSGTPVSDVSPLSGLTDLTDLTLWGTQVSDVTPLAGLTQLQSLQLGGSQIADLSPLEKVAATATNFSASGQNPVLPDATVGTSPLPIKGFSGEPVTVTAFGSATVDNAAGTITYTGPGTVTLSWQTGSDWYASDFSGEATVTVIGPPPPSLVCTGDMVVTPDPVSVETGGSTRLGVSVDDTPWPSADVTWLSSDTSVATVGADGVVTGVSPGTATLTITANFADGGCANTGLTGTRQVTVTAPVVPPATPSLPNSSAKNSHPTATTTGGSARVADGKDAYTITITVRDTDGQLMTGAASLLGVDAPKGLGVSGVTENASVPGSYDFTVTSGSAGPGGFQVAATLSGSQIGNPIPVNFIAGTAGPKSVKAGGTTTLSGSGFAPGEKVCALIHSDPLDCGCVKADADGTATFSVAIPADFAVGSHTAVFAGETSGSVSAPLGVVAADNSGAGSGGSGAGTGGSGAGAGGAGSGGSGTHVAGGSGGTTDIAGGSTASGPTPDTGGSVVGSPWAAPGLVAVLALAASSMLALVVRRRSARR